MSTSSSSPTVLRTTDAARAFAMVSAVVYVGAGIVGFLVTGFDDIASVTDEKVILLAVNPLHNVVHLVLGAVYAAGLLDRGARARQVNGLVGAGLLAAFVLGIAGGAQFLNIDTVSEPDNWLHLVWGMASIAFARRVAD